MTKIAFIGLGHMGLPMVRNLLQRGHTVQVFDITAEAMDHAEALGAIPASSPGAAAVAAEVAWTMLQTGEQVQEVCMGDRGIFKQLRAGALYIDSSSIDITMTRSLHQQAQQRSIAMVDAPVSGGVKGAMEASLTVMAGGATENFARAEPLLHAVGRNVFYAGAAGTGQAAKICNNLILGISMIAVSEGFILAEKLGLDAKTFYTISAQASGECWAMTHYNPVPGVLDNVPANDQYRPGFTAAMMLKDLKLSQDAAHSAGMMTELAAKATEIYQRFVDAGHAHLDFSGIIQAITAE